MAAGEPAWKVMGPWESQTLTGISQFSLAPTVPVPKPLPHRPAPPPTVAPANTLEWGKLRSKEDGGEAMLFPRNQMFPGL